MQKFTTLWESSTLLATAEHRATPAHGEILHELAISRSVKPALPDAIRITDAYTRRSGFGSEPMHLDELRHLLHLSLFATAAPGRKPYPAAGSVYAVQVYVAVFQVAGLAPGLYAVDWSERSLQQQRPAADALAFRDQCHLHPELASSAALVLLVADTRLAWLKYHDRSWRLALLEAGGLLQTLNLAASALGLSACALGGIPDRLALQVCDAEPVESVFFCSAMTLAKPVDAAAP